MKGRASAKTKRCGFKKGEGEEEEREKKQKKEKRKKKERKREKKKKSSLVYTSVARLLSFATCRGGTSSDQRAKEGEKERERRKVPQPASVSFHRDTEQWVRPISTIPRHAVVAR